MMVGYVITVNPLTRETTWSGLTQNFKLEIKGGEVGTSTFTFPGFTGEVDDILALRIMDGSGYLRPDTRVPGYRPAFYYGVITAVDKNTSVSDDENTNEDLTATVQCSDFKTYLSNTFIPEVSTTHENPFKYLKAIVDRWTERNNQNGIPMEVLSSTVSYTGPEFYYAKPTEAGTDELMTIIGRAFKNYQIPLVVVADTINKNSGLYLKTMFISGTSIGTVMIDDSKLIRGAKVVERPVGDGDYNAIYIGEQTFTVTKKKVKKGNKTTTQKISTYNGVTIRKRYINTESTIVSSITSKVKKPIKIKAYVKASDDKTALDVIAQNELSVTQYSHEITFAIHVTHPAILRGLAEIGNKVVLFYKGKKYKSYVSEVTIDSESEYIEIKCGNSKSTGLESLIDTNSKKVKGTSTKSADSTTTATSSSLKIASTTDIDGFF